jgi:hypothetical protein
MAMRSATRFFLDHLRQRVAGHVLGVAALAQAVGREVGFTAQLHDACGQQVGVALLLVGMDQELGTHALPVDAARHEVVAPITQHAHDLGGQRFVQQLQHLASVGAVAGGHGTPFHVLAGLAAQGGDIGQLVGMVHCLILSSFLTLLAPSAARAMVVAWSIWPWLLTKPVSCTSPL